MCLLELRVGKSLCVGFLVMVLWTASARAQGSTDEITKKSLEELMDITVTSASKKAENLSQAPAAIFVVTTEDIRRGGFTSIPEALRMVPGLYVTRINAEWWSVSARGFSDYLNNKMLVLVDGRSPYNPESGGIEWDQQQIPMELIERIEVIRGPGGTLWGANAVNGVINIVTKRADETRGAAIDTSHAAPSVQRAISIRYYASFGIALYYYGGIPLDQEFVVSQGVPTHNRLDLGLTAHGFRGFDLSVWGRDLTTDRHAESLPALFTTTGSYVRRSVVFNISWQSSPKPIAARVKSSARVNNSPLESL